ERGDITIRLMPATAPFTVNNFVFLAREGFYDGCTFHRVIPGFVAQGGDPTGTGRGGPGYRFQDELTDTPFAQGIIGMANAGPNTNGSQFFITTVVTPWLDGKHVVFGKVVEGLEIVTAIEKLGSQSGRTSKKIEINDCGEVA
ncbi:MAG: peptidylprolyl isomerase, partial [Thermoanaerobaculia bacterium]